MSEEEICGWVLGIFFCFIVLGAIVFAIVNCIASHIFAKKHKKCYELIDNHNEEKAKSNNYWVNNIVPLEKQIDELEIQKKYATLNKIKIIEQEQETLKQHLEYHRELWKSIIKTTKEKCEQLKKEIYDYMKNYKFFKKYVEEMNFIDNREL